MGKISVTTITIIYLLAPAAGGGSSSTTDDTLGVYLPREITIDGSVPRLGQVVILHGNKSLVSKAETITLGRISQPSQPITVDRNTVLSRLASHGIDSSQVKITGAEKVQVRRRGVMVGSDELVQKALTFLKENIPAGSLNKAELLREPGPVALGSVDAPYKLVPRLIASGHPGRGRVVVEVVVDGKVIRHCEVIFTLTFNCRKIVAVSDIAPGQAITAENVKIEKTTASTPDPAGWAEPYGMVVKGRVSAGTVLTEQLMGSVEPDVIVKRNQNVIIKVDIGGLTITATGKAIDEGAVGQIVRVRNVNSSRVITTRINKDGTVEPIL